MNETLVDKIYELIHEDIISMRFIPEQRLHIAELAHHYKVGPGPIREALSRLIATGLVTVLSQRGFRVSAISREDLNDVYQTRAHIEAIALDLAISHGNDFWEANIISTHHRLTKFEQEHPIRSAQDYLEWENRHRAFNLALIQACQLNYLLQAQAHLYNLTERYRRQWLIAGAQANEILPYAQKQKKIMDAVLMRHSELAIQLLHQHFEEAITVIEHFFQKKELF
jgi:GntR family carbon starvation induced transcriptional regulator